MNVILRNIALVLGFFGLLATGAQSLAAQNEPQPAVPEMIVAESLFDFGRVLEGTEVVHDFLVENRGTGDLAIDQVRTG